MTRRAVWIAQVRAVEADPRAVTVTCSTATLGRDNLTIPGSAWALDAYRKNPVWLWQHDPDQPIARAENITVKGDDLVARVRFPPAGVSPKADEILGLIRAGIVNAASTGFDVIASELIDRADPSKGTRITRAELQEVSFVSIPAVPDALVSQRAQRDKAISMQQHRDRAARYEREARARRFAQLEGVAFDKPAKRSFSMDAHRRMADLIERELEAEVRTRR